MEPIALADFTLQIRDQILDKVGVNRLDDLGGFEAHIFRVKREGKHLILRVTHESHRSKAQLEGELEWMRFLTQAGGAVCHPVPVNNQEDCVTVGPFTLSMMEEAKGRTVTESDWNPAFFKRWGQEIGRLHRLSNQYTPSRPEFKRPEWHEDHNVHFHKMIPAEQPLVRQVCTEVIDELKNLPVSPSHYGLVHCDPHPGNFFLDGDQLTFFDFDDACYQWFAYDIATIVLSTIFQPWLAKDHVAQCEEVQRFLPSFLSGYREHFEVPDFVLHKMPLFLKLRELSLYAISFIHATESFEGNSFGNGFLKGRRERIEARQPYLLDSFEDFI